METQPSYLLELRDVRCVLRTGDGWHFILRRERGIAQQNYHLFKPVSIG